jgi:hypothetical protein
MYARRGHAAAGGSEHMREDEVERARIDVGVDTVCDEQQGGRDDAAEDDPS